MRVRIACDLEYIFENFSIFQFFNLPLFNFQFSISSSLAGGGRVGGGGRVSGWDFFFTSIFFLNNSIFQFSIFHFTFSLCVSL